MGHDLIMNRHLKVGCAVALFLLAACSSDIDPNVEPVAQFYFERIVDSLPLDTSLVFRESVAYDTTSLDSLTRNWSEEEWLKFWKLVEKKQKDHKSSAVKAADK